MGVPNSGREIVSNVRRLEYGNRQSTRVSGRGCGARGGLARAAQAEHSHFLHGRPGDRRRGSLRRPRYPDVQPRRTRGFRCPVHQLVHRLARVFAIESGPPDRTLPAADGSQPHPPGATRHQRAAGRRGDIGGDTQARRLPYGRIRQVAPGLGSGVAAKLSGVRRVLRLSRGLHRLLLAHHVLGAAASPRSLARRYRSLGERDVLHRHHRRAKACALSNRTGPGRSSCTSPSTRLITRCTRRPRT